MVNVPTDLYELLDSHCTVEQLHALLRVHREFSPDIRIGTLKGEAIRNIRIAVDSHMIPVEAVHDLLRDSEENGDQHIFYFRPKNASVAKRCRDAEACAPRLAENRV